MDKIKVNNQVVSMRKFVKQAKIRTINKCTKQIKFLENRKGNDEQIAKSKRKLQRLLEEVNFLKKIQPDSVSKLVLSKEKDWKAVLAQKNATLEERCLAMLAIHPPVRESVEKFHSDNTELISKIPELVKEWEANKLRKEKLKSNDPNKVPIGNKNFRMSKEGQIKSQSTKSLDDPSDSSNLKISQKGTVEQKLKSKKTTKRKSYVDNLDTSDILSSQPSKKLLILSDAKSNEFDDSLDVSSDSVSKPGSPKKWMLSVKDKTKSDQGSKKACSDSLSVSSNIVNHQSSQGIEIPVEDKTGYQTFKNSQLKQHAVNPQTNLIEKKNVPEIEKMNISSSKKTIDSNEENSGELQGIRSKLLEMSNMKAKHEPRNEYAPVLHQLNANVHTDSDDDEGSADAYNKLDDSTNVSSTKTKPSFSAKPEMKNKIKAVTILDLNKLQDVDEIPIGKSGSDSDGETDEDSDNSEETDDDSGKQKKDPFFLCDGEPVSESEDEIADKEMKRKQNFPPFKKAPYGNFNKKEQGDNSFRKRKFDVHSANGRNSNFGEKGFVKNKKFSFNDNKQNFKRTFDHNSQYTQNKLHFASKDKFSNRNSTKDSSRNFHEKSFRQNHNGYSKGNSYPPKANISNSSKTVKPDDKPLHPSWEAKRKLKEAAKVKFQGKITYFDD